MRTCEKCGTEKNVEMFRGCGVNISLCVPCSRDWDVEMARPIHDLISSWLAEKPKEERQDGGETGIVSVVPTENGCTVFLYIGLKRIACSDEIKGHYAADHAHALKGMLMAIGARVK